MEGLGVSATQHKIFMLLIAQLEVRDAKLRVFVLFIEGYGTEVLGVSTLAVPDKHF
jgi:hypothetical protein